MGTSLGAPTEKGAQERKVSAKASHCLLLTTPGEVRLGTFGAAELFLCLFFKEIQPNSADQRTPFVTSPAPGALGLETDNAPYLSLESRVGGAAHEGPGFNDKGLEAPVS